MNILNERLEELFRNSHFEIKKEILTGKKRVILLEFPLKYIENNNVVCLDLDHQVQWKLKGAPHTCDNPFVHIAFEGKHIFAHQWDGTVLKVNPDTGSVIEKKIKK